MISVHPAINGRATLAIVLCAFPILVQSATAATYHCDPKVEKGGGDGSTTSPWPRLADLIEGGKLTGILPGDTLLLRDGDHGDVKFGGDNPETITIAAEPGHFPRLGRLEITHGSNWHVKGLTVSPAYASSPYKGDIVTVAERGPGSAMLIEDCFIHSTADASDWSAADWMRANSGILSGRHGKNITLRNNYILNTRFAVSLCSPDSTCEGNIIRNFSGDGIRITRDGITVQDNVVANAFVGAKDGDDNHDDLIQCFLFNVGTGTVRNLTVRGNVLVGNEDAGQPLPNPPQGIGFFDGPLVDFLVENNVVLVGHHHGISLYDAVNCTVSGNAVQALGATGMTPWIMLNTKNKGGSAGNKVLNNMAPLFDMKADASVVAENNALVDNDSFRGRLIQQTDHINGRFGEKHRVAHLPRFHFTQDPAPQSHRQPETPVSSVIVRGT